MAQELEEVFSWLEAGEAADYQAGVLLLQQHSRNRGLVNNLLKKESTNNREKLAYELVKVGCGGRMDDVSEVLNHFAQAVQGAVPAVEQPADVLTAPDFPAQPEPDQVPEAARLGVDVLTQLMSKVYNQRCQLSNSLADLAEGEGPGVVAQILSLEQQYNALAEKRRRMLAGDVVPAPTPAPETEQPTTAPVVDRAELVKQRGNLRSNLSKAKKSAAEAKSEEKRSEYAQKAGKLEVELSVVEMQLAQPQA